MQNSLFETENNQTPPSSGVPLDAIVSDFWQPTLQTTFDEQGNCFSACIATMYPISIDSVPFFENAEWQIDLQKWAEKVLGIFFVQIKLQTLDDIDTAFNGSAVITTINSPNPKVERHAVITRGENIIFDPMVGETKRPFDIKDDPTFVVPSGMRYV